MSYHERLKQIATPTASQIEEQKRRMSQGPTLEELEGRLQEAEQSFRDTSGFLGFSPEVVPVDDGTPPAAPTGIIATPFYRQLDLTWAEPPAGDHVVRAFIRARSKDNPEKDLTKEAGTWGGSVADLDPEPHEVWASFEDRWGNRSAWSSPVTATPMLTAAESIDLDSLAMQDRLRGMLPNVNLAPIGDASKFTEGVVRNTALAAGQNANVLPWEECEFENHADGRAWLPPGVVAVQTGGTSARVQTIAGKKWLRITTGTATGDKTLTPFADWAARGIISGQTYIASCYVRSASASPRVRLSAQHATDSSGSGAAHFAYGDYETLTGTGERRIWVKFTASRPFHRFTLRAENNNAVFDATRFQVEPVSAAQSEPGPYTVPVMAYGVMSGRMLSAMDLATVNAVIANAAIGSAKVAELSVDKLTAGAFTAGQMILAGNGSLRAGGIVVDDSGIKLPVNDQFDAPSVRTSYKVSSGGGFGSLAFVQANTNKGLVNGAAVRADGNQFRRGYVGLIATDNGNINDSSAAQLEVLSDPQSGGTVYAQQNLVVAKDSLVLGNSEVRGNLSVRGRLVPDYLGSFAICEPNGGTVTWTHNLGAVPYIQTGHQLVGDNQFKPLPAGGDGFGVFIEWCTTTQVRITNKESRGWQVRPVLYK